MLAVLGSSTRRHLPHLALALPFAFLLGACGGGETSELSPTTGLDGPDRRLSVEPLLVYTVGGMDAPEWASFGRIGGVSFDAEGNLYVLDDQADQVTVIGPEGEFVGTVGRPGQGPGEISSPFGLVTLPEGGVAVFDFGHQGFVIFDGAGEFVRNARVDMERLGLPDPSMSAHPAGGVVAGIAARTKLREPEPDLDAVPSRPVVLFALEEGGEGRVLHEAWDLPPVPVGEEQTLSLGGDQTVQLRMPRVRAFEPGLYVAVLPDGRIAVSDSVGYGVKLLDSSGTEVGRLSRPIDPILVTDGLQEQERSRRIDELAEQGGMQISFSGGGGGGGGDVSPEAVRRMMEERFADMLFAEVIPVIEAVAVDHAGRIWVQRSSGRPGVDGPTDVITPDELYLGTIPPDGLRIPAAFGPGGLMARIETDEFDVPTLVVERLPADLN